MTKRSRNIPGRSLNSIPGDISRAVGLSKVCELCAQQFSTAAKPRHNRALRYPKSLLNFLVLEIIDIRKQDDIAILLRKLLESRKHIFVGEFLSNRRFVGQRLL